MTELKPIYLTLALLVGLTAGATCLAQQPAKTLQWTSRADLYDERMTSDWTKRLDEIELEDISIDGASIAIGEPFTGNFRNLRFRVKNISDRPIDFVQITILLPELKHSPQIPLLRIEPKKEGAVQPGQETEVGIAAGKLYDSVTDMVSRRGREPQSITKVAIYMVQFGSHEAFYGRGGCMKARDSRNECPPR